MSRRIIARTIIAQPIIRNINTILNKMQNSLMDRIDNDGQVSIKIYKIGKNNIPLNVIVKQGNIQQCLQWCIQKQDFLKKAFNQFIINAKNNTDRKKILSLVKDLKQKIQSTELYSEQCFKSINKFIKQISNKNEKTRLPDSAMHNLIFGKNGIKDDIDLYRGIVTADRVMVLKSLKNYYTNNDSKIKYGVGIKTIKKAIDNNKTLNINTKNKGNITIRPIQVRKEQWSMLCDLLDDNGNVLEKIIICQSDIKK